MLRHEIRTFVRDALAEDVGRGDLSALLVPDGVAKAVIIAKDEGILAGTVYAQALCDETSLQATWEKRDGEMLTYGQVIVTLEGSIQTLLTVERTLLNLLQHASGIATQTDRFVRTMDHSNVMLLDTRKTRPLLRVFEKYSVRCGGGVNHRMGLDDAVMIKDTHWHHIGDLQEVVKKARRMIPMTTKIEIECETIEQVKQAIDAGADIVMCDNMPLEALLASVAYRNKTKPDVLIEASGNVSLQTIHAIATSGVDAISTGSLIHQAVWLDFSMKMRSA